MTTQVCIDAKAGQDCLQFTRTGAGPSQNWRFDHITSHMKTDHLNEAPENPGNSVNQGVFYVNQSAYGQLI